ncbi:MAG: bifunctional demethylmenaquinone methyltransferase/2-methoxy-6-polyprenyl-1,4-benzoquinol methylase UbiE [Bacteroidales bacterium]|nr:bifunctional demethylmenaquinone methyltransferase/2-methoxy-6-polyprenyl-1,4-benzoquinol methylase UbiE [Bacteroidales bacterium]
MIENQEHLDKLEGKDKREKVENMFDNIANNYDFLNHFLSFGIDYYWRNKVLNIIKSHDPKSILDIATGTGDLAILASKSNAERIVGIDISQNMLNVGIKKIEKKGLDNLITMQQEDSEDLSFDDNTFDLAMVAFGVRNFENLEKGLGEIKRVIKPGGILIVLEFSQPRSFPMKQLYAFYSNNILPTFGKIISNDASAYTYLPESVKRFPAFSDFTKIMDSVGFKNTSYKSLTSGISSIYIGEK